MKLRLSTWFFTVAMLLAALGGSAAADPATSVTEQLADAAKTITQIRQHGGDWAGPDLRPYSRDRKKGEIVGRPPTSTTKAVKPTNATRPKDPDTKVKPVDAPPVSVAPPELPRKDVAGAVPIQQLFDNGSLIPVWKGQGRVAGEMIELGLTNKTNQPIAIDLQPGMVLALEDEALAREFQPVMLESDRTLLVPANGTVIKMLRGYCLDYELEPPTLGRAFPYRFPPDTMAYAPAINVLKASLTYDAQERVLPPDQQRTIVIQRAIWAAMGQNDKEKLYHDILADAAAAGKTISKKKAKRMAETLWGEVERLMDMAQ